MLHELEIIAKELSALPPAPLPGRWQASEARRAGIVPSTLLECFFDLDGEQPLLARIEALCRCAIEHDRPITFQ